MSSAILIAQIVAIIIQACFLLVSIILIAGMIRQNENTAEQQRVDPNDLLEHLSREIDAELRDTSVKDRRAKTDEWDGKWPPWDIPGAENTSN